MGQTCSWSEDQKEKQTVQQAHRKKTRWKSFIKIIRRVQNVSFIEKRTSVSYTHLDVYKRQVLVKRYKESRRSHPLAMTGRVDDGIRLERKKTEFLRNRADYIIDTTHLLTRELKKELNNIFVDNGKFSNMMISVLSFGFKYGIPEDADPVSYTHLEVYKRQHRRKLPWHRMQQQK